MVHLLGQLSAVRPGNGGPVSLPPGRATLLFQRVAVAGGATVDVEALVDVLWQEAVPASAARTVASLVSRIRGLLGPEALCGQASAGYHLGVDQGWTTDLLELERQAAEARRRAGSAPALSASAARRGLDLLQRGPLLGGRPPGEQEWYDETLRRTEVLEVQLRRASWEAEARLGRWLEVARLAEDGLVRSPVDEHAARALMRAHWNLGDRGSALRVHDRLRDELRSSMEVEPSPETEDLYLAILRGDGTGPDEPMHELSVPDSVAKLGREEEYRQLVKHWERSAAGRSGVVLLTGARGSGRTRMAEPLIDLVTSTGGRALTTRSFEGERSNLLPPFLRLASQLLLGASASEVESMVGPWAEVAVNLVPDTADLLPPAPARRSSPDLEHHRTMQLLAHVFRQAATSQPLLLVIDDLHHAAASTLDALSWLLEELPDSPFLVLGITPADEPIAADERLPQTIGRVALGPLSRRAVAALAREAGHPQAAPFVWDLTHGHLHFVEEVLNLLKRGVHPDDVPGSLQHLATEEVERWEPEARELLQAAAVIGPAFDLATLEALTDRHTRHLLPHLDIAVAQGYLETGESQYLFTNDVIHAALLASMPGPVRQRHHLRLIDLLADQPERRASHLAAVGRSGDAALAWLEAARSARAVFANADARRLATRAIESAERADDDVTLAEALLARGAASEELGDYDAAADDHERAGTLWLRTGDRSLRTRALERAGWTAYYRRDPDQARRLAEEVVAQPGSHPGAWALLGRVLHWAGDFDRSAQAYHRALELSADRGVRASVLSCLGALYAHSDRFDEAIRVLDEAVELSNDIGAFRPLMRTLFFQGLAQANDGRFSAALTTLETKAELLSRYGVTYYRARTNTCLAWVWRELGDLHRAEELSARALEQSLEVDDQVLQLEQELHARCSLADVALANGDQDAAAEQLEASRRLIEQWLPFRWRAELRIVEIGARIRDDDPEHLLGLARERRSAKYEALALHLLGRAEEASEVAAATGSALLLAEVAPEPEAKRARKELLGRLPARLRAEAASSGRLFAIR